ncbi:hypothetical protein HF576_09140 [Microbacterium sp. CFH 90308]|uniref:DUF1330 domain-containing protein n=1 Tax=Microbacterium salsuginis TaxID=2722803 RepID=A0ABX1KAG5_9MICO|nr:hypothetical protein [Microbacterium sp. CFH 90308]NLP84013.1 hypothetical protein [Microbacterium sp. CFH 90308]
MRDGLTLCCLLWAHPGTESDLVAYEDRVLALLPEHGIELVARAIGDGRDGTPIETQVYRIPDQAALDAYTADPRRTALADERERVIARTELFPVALR